MTLAIHNLRKTGLRSAAQLEFVVMTGQAASRYSTPVTSPASTAALKSIDFANAIFGGSPRMRKKKLLQRLVAALATN
jgi:hypothetical protein